MRKWIVFPEIFDAPEDVIIFKFKNDSYFVPPGYIVRMLDEWWVYDMRQSSCFDGYKKAKAEFRKKQRR